MFKQDDIFLRIYVNVQLLRFIYAVLHNLKSISFMAGLNGLSRMYAEGRKAGAMALVGSVCLCCGAVSAYSADGTEKTMLNIPAVNAQLARAGMNSLQKRLGDLQDMDNLFKKHGVWARGYLKDMTVKELTKTDADLAGLEAGYDWLLLPDAPTRLYVGIMGGYMDVNSVSTSRQNNSYSKGDGYAPSVGLYATLINADRWFLDWTVRDFWSTLHMKQYKPGQVLEYKPKRNVLATSLEGGKGFLIPVEQDAWVTLTPKLELSYMYAFASSTDVKNGVGDLSYKDTSYLSGKLAVQVGYKTYWLDELFLEPFAELGYGYEWKGRDHVTYNGVTEVSSAKGGTFEADLGLNMQLGRNWYWYLLGSWERGPKLDAYGFHAGIRYTFGNQPSLQAQQTAVRAAQARAQGFTKKMNQQNQSTTYVPAASMDRAGQAYARPVHTDEYVYPQRARATGYTAAPSYSVQDVEGYVELTPEQAALEAQARAQSQINSEEALAQLQAQAEAAAREEQAKLEKAKQDRQEFIDEFIGDSDIWFVHDTGGIHFEQKPARLMWKN